MAPNAPDDSLRVSLLPYHYPKRQRTAVMDLTTAILFVSNRAGHCARTMAAAKDLHHALGGAPLDLTEPVSTAGAPTPKAASGSGAGGSVSAGECLSRLLPRFKRLPVAPSGSQWLPVAPAHTNTRCCWLLLAPNGSR